MIIACAELESFFDGELAAAQAAEFRDHLAGCARCQRVLLGRMQEALVVDAGADVRLPDARARRRKRRRVAVLATLVPVLGAAAVSVVLSSDHPAVRAAPLEVAISVDHPGPAMRGTSAHPGDVLRVTARGARHRAIWVYRNERELVASCPELRPRAIQPPGCQVSAATLDLALALDSRGSYAVVTLGAASILPSPSGTLDADLDAASGIDGSYQVGHLEVD